MLTSLRMVLCVRCACRRVVKQCEFRAELQHYLHERMGNVAPNLGSLVGDQVGARLITHAGSITNLAKYPASTVQILGAEKALFRALKTKGNTPKYGLIFHSSFIGRASAKNKGRISRYLANKCSMAARIDAFSDEPNSAYGERLKEQVEERLRFYDGGATPRKNVDVMEEAEAASHALSEEGGKKRKRSDDEMDVEDADEENDEEDVESEDETEKEEEKEGEEEEEERP